ncbi:MAG: DUF4214 domain-containing protein [Candidatus Aminicenantes bacterium]|nr:MAG: DUF4214 domain-containing protein [Candidatus Aminicenantes bacterium]
MSKNFTGLVLAGYQGWFATPANQNLERWSHWSKRGEPGPGGYTNFELYPDLSGYEIRDLYQSGYADLPDGGKWLLYDSDRDRVVNLHFQWMKEYGLDGVSLQRFSDSVKKPKNLKWRNSTAVRVRNFSESTGKSFYIMYDISGHSGDKLVEDILTDFEEYLKKKLKLLDSPGYARHDDGRPVIAIWGLGFKDRPGSKEEAERLIKELRETYGCYVAGGVPYYWREQVNDSKPGWLGVYKLFDMLIPWAVGRYHRADQVDDHFESIWQPDKEFCDAENMDLQRVIYPGFAWSNLKEHQRMAPGRALSRHASATADAPRNQIPRLAGQFFWRQAYHVARLGTSAFIAMFDEFDEATAIAKAAKSQAGIPADQYFLTLDADGTRLSSDFYLRLAGEATKMIKEKRPIEEVPVSHLNYKVHVNHGYRALLGRDPDPGGLNDYSEFLETGGTMAEFCQKLVDSDEFKNKRQNLPARELARALYQGVLQRLPEPEGLNQTITAIENGEIVHRAADMLNSPEFFNKFA